MDFKWVEKWFKCTELFIASGFYFLCELYLSKDFIIVNVVHAAIVKIVSPITNPLFQLGFIIHLEKSPWAKDWHTHLETVVLIVAMNVIKYVVNIQISICYFYGIYYKQIMYCGSFIIETA